MKQLKESFIGNELSGYLQERLIEEGKITDFFKKTFNYLKNKVAKIGNMFVSLFNDKILPAVLPITSQAALKNGNVRDTECIHWMGTKEDAKYSGVDTTGNNILDSRPSTIEMWTKAAKSAGIRESVKFEGKNLKQILEVLKLQSDDNQIRNIDSDELKRLIEVVIRKGANAKPLLIWGAPGIGKTAIVNAVLKQCKGSQARMLDMQLSMKAYDDFFLPSYNADKTVATDVPKSYLPVWEDRWDMTDEERKKADEACGTGLLFLDELSRAKPQVQNVVLKLANERKLGDSYRLGSGWSVVAASNRLEDDEDSQQKLGQALGNRFRQVNYSPTCKSWIKWAQSKGYMNQHVLDWLEQNEKYFYFQDNDETTLFCTPRAWESACQALADESYTADEEGFDLLALPDDVIMASIQDNVGLTAARAFMDYVRLMRTINIDDLKMVLTKPEKAPLPKKTNGSYKPDIIYIITTTIISFLKEMPDPKTFKNLCTWFARLENESAAGKMWTMLCRKFPNLNYHFGEGDESNAEFDDSHVEGLQILIKAYPEWEHADFS
jgi:hypothetical protein